MSNKYYLLILTLSLFVNGFSQKNSNDYKYVVVPIKFDFFEEDNKYQLNELVEFLFNKHGYTAFLGSEDFPQDLVSNSCLAMYANVKEVKSLFSIKVMIELKDCKGELIVASEIGKTKVKEFDKAYSAAIRDAFSSIAALNYKYNPNSKSGNNQAKGSVTNEISNENSDNQAEVAEIKRLQQELDALKEQKKGAESSALQNTQIAKEEGQANPKIVTSVATLGDVVYTSETKDESLFANPISNGFQVVDASKKDIMVLLYSGSPDTYIVKGQDAIVFKKANTWMYAINDASGLSVKQISLKF